MRHDELRDYIDKFDAAGMVDFPAIKAIRAVVELHKPRNYKAGNWCIGCNADYEYPCPTIQAIEKELA